MSSLINFFYKKLCGVIFAKKGVLNSSQVFRNFSVSEVGKKSLESHLNFDSVGTIISIVDGIVKVKGLFSVGFGELVVFSSSEIGIVLSIESNYVQVVLFGSDRNLLPGQTVTRKHSSLEVFVSFDHLGRVVNSLGEFIDGEAINLDSQNRSETYESLTNKNLNELDENKLYNEWQIFISSLECDEKMVPNYFSDGA